MYPNRPTGAWSQASMNRLQPQQPPRYPLPLTHAAAATSSNPFMSKSTPTTMHQQPSFSIQMYGASDTTPATAGGQACVNQPMTQPQPLTLAAAATNRFQPTAYTRPMYQPLQLHPVRPGGQQKQQWMSSQSQSQPRPFIAATATPIAPTTRPLIATPTQPRVQIQSGTFFLQTHAGTFLTVVPDLPFRLVHLDGRKPENQIVMIHLELVKEVRGLQLNQPQGPAYYECTLQVDEAYLSFEPKDVSAPAALRLTKTPTTIPLEYYPNKAGGGFQVAFRVTNDTYMSVRSESGSITYGVKKVGPWEKFNLVPVNTVGAPYAATLHLHPDITLPSDIFGWRFIREEDDVKWWSFQPKSWDKKAIHSARATNQEGKALPFLTAQLDYAREAETSRVEMLERAAKYDKAEFQLPAPRRLSPAQMQTLFDTRHTNTPYLIQPTSTFGVSSAFGFRALNGLPFFGPLGLPPKMKLPNSDPRFSLALTEQKQHQLELELLQSLREPIEAVPSVDASTSSSLELKELTDDEMDSGDSAQQDQVQVAQKTNLKFAKHAGHRITRATYFQSLEPIDSALDHLPTRPPVLNKMPYWSTVRQWHQEHTDRIGKIHTIHSGNEVADILLPTKYARMEKDPINAKIMRDGFVMARI